MQGVPGAAEVVYEDFGMSKKIIKDEEDRRERRTQEAALVTEADVVASISVPLDSGRDAALLVSPVTTTEEVGPSVVRSIARLTVYEMLKDYKNGKLGTVGPEERTPDREEAIKTPPVRDKMPLVDWELFRRRASCLAEKLALPSRYWDCLSKWTEQYYAENAPSIWDKLWDRAGRARASHSRRRKRRDRKRVRFDCSALYVDRAEAVGGLEMNPVDDEDVSHYVNVVGPLRHRPERKEKHGLVKVVTVNLPNGFGMKTDEEDECDFPEVVKGGRRVVCAVGSFEALSGGMIDCLPSRMLADTGATLSLVDTKVLKRLGRASESLKPYDGLVRSSSGHRPRIRGWMVLPIRLGSLEITMSLLVADQLHCDAILGVDALGVFGAVIDVAERTMTLKSTQEVLALGVTVVQETYMTAMAVSVRLPPRGQALVMTNVIGEAADDATVLVEGSLGLPPTLCVARTLCAVQKGQVIVEVCNASTDEYWIKKGTVVASTAVIPESAFASSPQPEERSPENGKQSYGNAESEPEAVRSVTEERKERTEEKVKASKPDIPPDKGAEADFSDSKLSGEQKALFQDELNAFSDLFAESSKKPGRTDLLKFEIDTGDNRPIKQQPYRVSGAEGEVMEAEVEEYLDLGLIRPSNSPWASPVLMIRKPDGGIRFCIDYRRLNAVTVKDCYPMPLIDDILDVLGDARLFSTMDIAFGYWNVPMHENSVAKTAFTCKYGLYEWLVMPFGLCNAVPAFERLMETVLVDLKWRVCLVYLDDCVIFSKDFPSHLIRVRQVLTRFRQAGFKLKMKKCHWGRSQVAFLGHIVTPTGILPNPEKVKAVMNVQRPCDVHGIRSFLGLTSYFRRYIPGYALISAPLERLKVKEAPFFWNEDCESAFRQLKRALMKPPILVYPDMKKRFKLYVDSSRYVVGAYLMQESGDRDRVVAYASKLLTGSQKNWITKQDGISEIECWGVVWATRKFRCYLDKREFDVFTDHQALAWVFRAGNRTGNAKLARWAMELSNLQFKVHHKPGTTMGHVDGLSRLQMESVNALTMADLLNPERSEENGVPSSVGEPSETVPEPEVAGPASEGRSDSGSEPELEDDDELELEYATEPTEVETGEASATPVTPSSVDVFGLDSELFLAEQQEVTWIRALVALLQDGAVPLDPFLRRRLVQMAPKHCVANGLLMRTVHLPANVGPARTVTVPVVPLPYVNTVLHFCHRDLLSSHLGLTKTLEKVRRHAYWPGWRKDVAEYLRDCMKCGGGKGPRDGRPAECRGCRSPI
ncbi:hypothetical protein PF003_g36339 [Phytophthora fragariae]|uniref:RNA-directed DNA polymerase n=2 Tax=Phytophthora fragariae TaxID=53985 RepID=A0A6A3DX74_9STRA|nr:hypothetical protein PF003_g36339 [Phytophthora fragariae]KAE8926332.1 hypothetical protein PF009_g23481 [Phytophthora fragariae]